MRYVNKSAFNPLINIVKEWPFFSLSNTVRLMQTFIFSRLDYCNALISGPPKKSYKLVTAESEFCCLLVFKPLNGLAPAYLSDMLTMYEPGRPLRSFGTSLLVIPKCRTKAFGEAAFSFYASSC